MVLPKTESVPTYADTQVDTCIHLPQKHADILFTGNKNGSGPKLASMDTEDWVQVDPSSSLQLEHALESCDTVGDIMTVSKRRRKNIPETVKLEKNFQQTITGVCIKRRLDSVSYPLMTFWCIQERK